MKWIKFCSWRIIPFWGFLWIIAGCGSDHSGLKTQPEAYYTCSMHTQVHEDKPGNCPICGMKLVRVSDSGQKAASLDASLRYLTEPVTRTVIGTFKVMEPFKGSDGGEIIAEGHIDFDKRDLNLVSTRVAGRIEHLYVQYQGQSIIKGQPLLDIYSPELLSIQENLLQAVRDKDSVLVGGIEKQLLNLGMHATEIQKVIQRRQALTKVTIYSPFSGMLTKTSTGDPAMDNSSAMQMAAAELQADIDMEARKNNAPGLMTIKNNVQAGGIGIRIREGMYVQKGQAIISVQHINRAWAMLDVFTPDIWRIHTGDTVRLYAEASPGDVLTGRVDFIPPVREPGQKTTSVRVYLDHLPATWKIGTLIQGQITVGATGEKEQVFVPAAAVNRLGRRAVVWVQDKQHLHVFHVRNVKTGVQVNGRIQILNGLAAGDKIAVNAAYMVDSDSFTE